MKCALNLKESTAGQIMFRDMIETEIKSSKLFILELKLVKSSASDQKSASIEIKLEKA